MVFHLDFEKALQASAFMVRNQPTRTMNYMRLLKLLYIADRESFRSFGKPITGDRPVAMQRGPVLSELLDTIKGQGVKSSEWDRYFSRDSYMLSLSKDNDPGNHALSVREIQILSEVSQDHASHDEWDMVDFTHQFDEWKKNQPPPSSSRPIQLEDILEAVGRGADAAAIRDAMEEDRRIEAQISRLSA